MKTSTCVVQHAGEVVFVLQVCSPRQVGTFMFHPVLKVQVAATSMLNVKPKLQANVAIEPTAVPFVY